MTAILSPFPGSAHTDREAPSEGQPVAVLSTYTVSAGKADLWLEVWQHAARTAVTWPGCRAFHPFRDRNDEMYCGVVSEWDSLEAYNSFMTDPSTSWVSRAIAGFSMPGECRFLELS